MNVPAFKKGIEFISELAKPRYEKVKGRVRLQFINYKKQDKHILLSIRKILKNIDWNNELPFDLCNMSYKKDVSSEECSDSLFHPNSPIAYSKNKILQKPKKNFSN